LEVRWNCNCSERERDLFFNLFQEFLLRSNLSPSAPPLQGGPLWARGVSNIKIENHPVHSCQTPQMSRGALQHLRQVHQQQQNATQMQQQQRERERERERERPVHLLFGGFVIQKIPFCKKAFSSLCGNRTDATESHKPRGRDACET